MCFAMDPLGGGGVRRMNEAEGGSAILVKPIGHVFDPVAVLNVDVRPVRLGDVLSLQAAQVVAVHVDWHGALYHDSIILGEGAASTWLSAPPFVHR